MKNKSIVSLVCAMLGLSALADYDYHSFTSGTPIPLFDSSTSAALSYVELKQNAKRDGTVYEMAQSANGNAPIIVVYLNNETAGDYLFYFKGSSKNAAATYTATIAGVDDTTYTKTLTGTQVRTSDWRIDAYGTDHWCYVDGLPAGKFTLTFTVTCSNGWMGHYGNFTFTKASGTLDVTDNLDTTLDLGTPYADSNNRFDTQTLESWVALVRSSSDTGHNRLLLENNGATLGSTKHGDAVTFYLDIDAKATYHFAYQAGTSSGNTGVSIAWSLWNATTDTEVYSGSDDVTPNDSNVWTLSNDYTNSFGALTAGAYILKATVQRPTATGSWACNFGNFKFSRSLKLELDGSDGSTIELDEDSLDREVVICNNPTVDLMGHDLTLNVASTTFSGTLAVTNSNTEDVGVLTLKGAVTTSWLQSITVTGNVKLIVDGNVSNDDPKFATNTGIANTHTGGTVFLNQTRRVYTYGVTANFGTGALGFAGDAFLFIPSSSLFDGYGTVNNDIDVAGTGNRFAIEGIAWGDHTINFNGAFSGDGELYLFNGWQPDIHFNAAGGNADFTGTLYLGYTRNDTQGFFIDGSSTGFTNATVCLTNVIYGSGGSINNDKHCTHVTFKQDADEVFLGHLITDAEAPIAHTNTQLIANHSGTTTLHVGSLGMNGSFAGAFVEQSGKAFKVVKEGAGSWTLAGTNPSTISGGIEVDGGTLYLETTFTAATAVNVNNGGSFYGTIPANVTVTWNAGSVIDCDTAHTITGDVDLSNAVVTGNNPVDGQVFLTVTGTATGKPSVSAALAAVEKYNGRRGKWDVTATTENGVTTYSLAWKLTAFMVIIR